MIYGDKPQLLREYEDPLGLSCYTYAPNINAIRQSMNLYGYTGNNPISYIDPTGCMAVWMLNTLSFLYNKGLIGAADISVLTLIMNGANIGTGFHEIAQLNIAKYLASNGFSPQLEFRVGKNKEIDIVAGNMAWEVKPWGDTSGLKQLNDYIALSGGTLVPGTAFPNDITDIPIIGKYYMGINFSKSQPGVANYYFYYYSNGFRQQVTSTSVANSFRSMLVWASLVASTVVVGTLVEDGLTAGAGVADDVPSLIGAAALARLILGS